MEKVKKSRNKFLQFTIIILIILLLLYFGWNKLQDYLFFHPWNDIVSYKKLQETAEFKEVKIKNNEVNLSGWFWNIQNKNEKAPLLIFFPGNAQNSSNTMYNYSFSSTMNRLNPKDSLFIFLHIL